MHIHKKYFTFLVLAILLMVAYACNKVAGYNTVVSEDTSKPDVVKNIRVVNFNGGAHIIYDLPGSKNILYVQAEYKINDVASRQSKSSYYTDTITVSGFAQSKDYTVTLYTVSRAEVKSDPVVVTVHPGTPPYLLARPTVEMKNDFGGVQITVKNAARADIGIITITQDAVTKKMEIVSQHYTNQDSLTFSLRGYDTIPRQFGVYITDKWNNVSDTALATITPIYEQLMNKSRFQPYTLPTDAESGFGWVLPNMWDGKDGSTAGFHTEQPIQPLVWPAVITFDMGQVAKLSRYTIWNRGIDISGNWLWQAGAPQTWVLWGRADQPVDETMPDEDHLPPVGASTPNGWINLGFFTAPAKPSGLPNPQYNNADLAFWNAGFSYNFPLSLPKVRYIRVEVVSNMANTNNFFNIAELSFWGDDR
jgi:hypothetical protein